MTALPFAAIAAPIIAAGGSYGDVAAAAGLTYHAARMRCRRAGLQSMHEAGRREAMAEVTPAVAEALEGLRRAVGL